MKRRKAEEGTVLVEKTRLPINKSTRPGFMAPLGGLGLICSLWGASVAFTRHFPHVLWDFLLV